ncbi:MAG: TAXI family TRAP transporter solute-binding subunit [Rickettsiales bacterium]|nr:TAXI family TRAP transporter solute-binding subunit [Rickettsiales bacterium]
MRHFLLSGLFAIIAVMGMAPEPAQARDKFVTIGTGGVTGVYYPAGGAICRLVNRGRKEHGIRCSVESTGGSIYNLNAISQGELDLGVAQSDWHYNAYMGKGVFTDQGANKKLRSLFSLHSEPFTVVARADSGIKVFDDLKGHRVNIGNPGSGMRATMEEVMKAKGWSRDVFSLVSELKASEQAQALCDNKIDAMVFAAGHPNGSIQEVTTTCETRLINVDGAEIEKLIKENPYYAPAIIPGGMYTGNPDDIATFGVKATFVSSADVDEDVIYQIVKAVFANFDSFKTLHFVFASLDKTQMVSDGLTAPLHKGAEKYYKEAGLLK